jgi:hypothetical protein
VVPLLRDNDREVLYIGDHEIGGPADQIEANTYRTIEAHAGRVVRWTRIAVTQAQVDADPRLLGLVITKYDRRTKTPRKYEAVECEAVGQVTLERLLRVALEKRLPEPLADELHVAQHKGATLIEWWFDPPLEDARRDATPNNVNKDVRQQVVSGIGNNNHN